MVQSLVGAAWQGAQFGLGAALGDRWFPRRWSRALRWGAGMSIAALVLHPWGPLGLGLGIATGTVASTYSVPLGDIAVVWNFLIKSLALAVLLGLALGWAACATRWRGWKLAGAGAGVWTAIGVVSLAVKASTNATMSLYGLLAVGPITGALVGLAFAAALSIGERRAQVSKPE